MTSVNTGSNTGSMLARYRDFVLGKSAAAPSSGTSAGQAATSAEDAASIVSLSPKAQAMLIQARGGQRALSALADAVGKGDDKDVAARSAGETLPAGWTPTGTGTGYTDAKEAQPGDSPAVRFEKMVNLSADGLTPYTNMMTDEGKASFLKAVADGTVSVRRAEDVPDLNYQEKRTITPGPDGGSGEDFSFSYNQSLVKTEYLISGDRVGGLLITWPGAPVRPGFEAK